MNIENLVELFKISHGPNKLRPCLVGETGGGKTARVHQAAEALNLPLTTILLSQCMPEDVVGLPKMGRTSFEYVSPKWSKELSEKPGILFLDEIDKAREETKGAVLTLLWDFQTSTSTLHPDTIIVCAMQPEHKDAILSTETGKALMARFVLVPIEYDWNYVEDKHSVDLSDWPTPPAVSLPVSDQPSPRQTDLAIEMMACTRTQEVKDLIAHGTHPEKLANILLAPRESVKLTPEFLLDKFENYTNDLSVLDKEINELEPIELMSLAPEAVYKSHPEIVYRILAKTTKELSQENMGAMLKNIYEYVQAKGGKSISNEDDSLMEAALDKATFDVAIHRGVHPYTGNKLQDDEVEGLYRGIGETLQTYRAKQIEVYGEDGTNTSVDYEKYGCSSVREFFEQPAKVVDNKTYESPATMTVDGPDRRNVVEND